jgi:succinate-semialdehyde dehydrogenase / glutarate-semialdehyde dehydrogenase
VARPTSPPCGSGSLTDVTPDARPSEEFFAQVVVVYSATDDEAAVQLANSSPCGLSGAVYCSFEHGS